MSFLLPGLHRPSRGREGLPECPTQETTALHVLSAPCAHAPGCRHLGNLGKAPRDPEAGQLGTVPEGLWFVPSPPHREKGSPACLGVLCDVISVFLKFI